MAETTTPPDPKKDSHATSGKRKGFRRILTIVIVILSIFVVYAFAFATTDVSLDELQSERRQEQLFRILRALAHPDLIHYDKEDVVISSAFFVPCNGQEPDAAPPASTGATVVIEPTCANPGETVTVTGSGFDPTQLAIVEFVPISDFEIVLPQGRSEVSDDGTFTHEFVVPERENDEAQEVRVTTQTNIGKWTARQSVWTDTNLNSEQDPKNLPDAEDTLSAHALLLPDFEIREPGGVTLIDENNNVLDFISWGGSFEATTGSASGFVSRDLGINPSTVGVGESVQLTGVGTNPLDFEWTGPASASFGELNEGQQATETERDVFFNEIAFGAEPRIEVIGTPGTALGNVSLIFFEAENGAQYKIVPIADETNLSPRLSDNALATWDRIIETVMLALLATTVGTMLAVPLSFLASRNLMRDVTVPVINLAMSLIALPIGLVIGVQASRWARSLDGLADANVFTLAIVLVALAVAVYYLLRWIFPPIDQGKPSMGVRVARTLGLIGVGFIALTATYIIGGLFIIIGEGMEDLLSAAMFLGSFVVTVGELVDVLVPIFSGLIGAFAVALAASKLGYYLDDKLPRKVTNGMTLVLSALSGALVAIGVGAIIEWFYQLENPLATVYVPALIGALIGMLLSVKAIRRAQSQNIGLTIYYMARTVFNALRSIEPLVMVIIFVVWVGIGPFAGALALALHTTAALAKLYSEQVESINTGPLEAVRATGATRLQTIIFGVVPQIVPPYISFTMYRWDINVRMSTIIGFAGGGGIGFLLQQNINLLQYRAAAAQMLAIAIVVASMDYVSSRLREHYI